MRCATKTIPFCYLGIVGGQLCGTLKQIGEQGYIIKIFARYIIYSSESKKEEKEKEEEKMRCATKAIHIVYSGMVGVRVMVHEKKGPEPR